MGNNKEDAALVKLLEAGEQTAFVDIYHKYKHGVFRNITQMVKDPMMAEDILQEVFLTVWNKRTEISTIKALGNWIFVISYNKSIDYLKKRVRESKVVELMAEWPEDSLNLAGEPEEDDDYYEKVALLHNAIERLPQQKKKVFQLFRFEGKSHEEIATITGISIQSVKDYLKQCTAMLKKYLDENAVKMPPSSRTLLVALACNAYWISA